MRKPIGCASAALLLFASASAEDDAAADPAPDGEVEPAEDEAPLRRQLDDALEEIKGDGTVDDLKKKYFPSPERPDG